MPIPNTAEMLTLSSEELFERATTFFRDELSSDPEERAKQALEFFVLFDFAAGNKFRTITINTIQSASFTKDIAQNLLDGYLLENADNMPTQEELEPLLENSGNMTPEQSRKAGLFLISQPDLQPVLIDLLVSLAPYQRNTFIRELVEKSNAAEPVAVEIDTFIPGEEEAPPTGVARPIGEISISD